MKESPIREKSYAFALEIIRLLKLLQDRREFVLSRQLLRSGTSIGANVEEAQAGQSRADFASKMSIASKEARESNYWLRLLRDSQLLPETEVSKAISQSTELVRMLTSIVKSTVETPHSTSAK
jgi:four helix bundle protein